MRYVCRSRSGSPSSLTLERVRICKRDGELLGPPPAVPGGGDAGMPVWHKLMVYTSEQACHDGRPIHQALVRRLRQGGARGATALRGVWGFHGDHAPHGDRFLPWNLSPEQRRALGSEDEVPALDSS